MPLHDPLAYARPRRRPHGRLTAIALTGAVAVLLALPASGPTGHVLDLVGHDGAAVIGQEPTPAEGPVSSPAAARPAASPPPRVTGAGVAPESTLIDKPGPTAPPVEALKGYVWPIAHPRLTLPFGPTVWGSRWVDGERFHDGVDLATFCGDRVVAAHGGRVLAAGRKYDAYMGWIGDLHPYLKRLDQKGLWMTLPIVVVIDDGNGYRSVYAHFGRVIVKPGQTVKAGQRIGYEGATGRASGCHLHYGLFSPWEQESMAIRPDVVKRMKLPKAEIARIDPLLILPPKPGINAPATPKPSTPAPATAPSPKPAR
ncbi:MAG: M23 family metallopeptidase [Candidatus Limnocylindrales bacterium]